MPRRQTGLRRRTTADGLSPRAVAYFFSGPDSNNQPFSNLEAARPVWKEHEKVLMQWWTDGLPDHFDYNSYCWHALRDAGPQGGMPWAWWKFSAPEPRQLVKVYDDGDRQPTEEDRLRAYSVGMGRSDRDSEYADGIGYAFESDAEYLARLGLDTP